MSNHRNDVDSFAAQFKALSNPHRLALFRRLTSCCPPGTSCSTEDAVRYSVGQLGADIDISISTLSHHLKELKRAGLVQMARKGKQVECWVAPQTLEQLSAFFAELPAQPKDTRNKPMSEQNTCCGTSAVTDKSPSAADHDAYRQSVREKYSQVAKANNERQGCGGGTSCCGPTDDGAINTLISTRLGYSQADLDLVPSGADMGLGCGNPKAIAALKSSETVVDLGSGGGFDCFLAAREVGSSGRVIGVDMTPDMVSKARANALKGRYENVEFRLGEIEHLPIADVTADVIISNCVINLSPNKPQVFRDAFRVLKPDGRLAISDVVATVELPEEMRNDAGLIAGCTGNAALIDDLEAMMRETGFEQIRIQPKDESKEFIKDWAPGHNVTDYVVSATIEAVKPGGCGGGK
nr:arsenite methyltransferase [Verrucomicrobium sp. 3C]